METVLFISLIKICSFPKFFNFFGDPLYGIHPSSCPPHFLSHEKFITRLKIRNVKFYPGFIFLFYGDSKQ